PVVRRDGASDASGREEFAEYAVAAWDTGFVRTRWSPVMVLLGSDTVLVPLEQTGATVLSVLSADTAEHIPRPAKPPFGQESPWWMQWWLAMLVVAALAALAWVLWRRRDRGAPVARAPRPGPYEFALEAFDRLDRLALSDAGEHGRAAVLAMDILRGYLS